MTAVQLPDELQRVIEQQIVEGHTESKVAFLEKVIMRLVDEVCAEEEDIFAVVEAGRLTSEPAAT